MAIENSKQDWIFTILQSVGGTLVAILLVWIAGNQVKIITSQAVLQRDFAAQAKALDSFTEGAKGKHTEVDSYLAQIWPRLRVHGENIEALRREIQALCGCIVQLKSPEKF